MKTKDKIERSLKGLLQKRKIFHSEADFQHALAIQLREDFEDFEIRLEKRVPTKDKPKNYVDLLLFNKNEEIYIELKYKTKNKKGNVLWDKGEDFLLANQVAQNNGCYYFFKDIYDLENIKGRDSKKRKYFAIFLTNDLSYTRKARDNSKYKPFEINQGRRVSSGKIGWNGDSNFKQPSLKISGDYKFDWKDYSTIDGEDFKFLLVEVFQKP